MLRAAPAAQQLAPALMGVGAPRSARLGAVTERKDATDVTAAANAAVAAALPLGDETDFDRARRGLLVEAPRTVEVGGLPV